MKPSEFAYPVAGDASYHIQYKGVWDMQDLVETMSDFFKLQKFKIREKLVLHKRPSPFGVERKYFWEAWRDVEDYYKFVVDIFFHTYDAQDVEVKLPDGSKKTYTKGRIWIQYNAHVVVDYAKKWEGNAFFAQLRNFYNKYVVQKKIEALWLDELHYKVGLKFRNLIQQRLKMETEEYEHRYFAGVH